MKYLLFILLLLSIKTVSAQEGLWYGNIGMGPINYWGDLQDKRLTTTGMQFNATAGITYLVNPHIFGNFSLTFGKLGANDANNGPKWKYRNLSFQSSFFEAAFTAEYALINIIEPDDGNFIDANPNRFTPYAFAGLGIFHFNPYTYDQSGSKVMLQPLGTEGQLTPYSLWQLSIPYGVGIRYALTNTIFVSAEIDLRKTFTDYIDDVSEYHYLDTTQLLMTHGQEAASLSYRADEIPNNKYQFWGYRGNPTKKDGYYSFMIKASIQLFTRQPKFYYGY